MAKDESMTPITYILSKNPTKRSYILNADVDALPPLLPKLAQKGCRNLYGFGKEESIYNQPDYTEIKYEVNDKRNCHFPDKFFDIIIDGSGEKDGDLIYEYDRLLPDNGIMILKRKGRWKAYTISKTPGFKLPQELNIVVSTKGIPEGIRYTTDIMKKRLEDYGIKVNLCKNMK